MNSCTKIQSHFITFSKMTCGHVCITIGGITKMTELCLRLQYYNDQLSVFLTVIEVILVDVLYKLFSYHRQ